VLGDTHTVKWPDSSTSRRGEQQAKGGACYDDPGSADATRKVCSQGALFYDAKPTGCGGVCSDACDCTNYTVAGGVDLAPTGTSEYLKSGRGLHSSTFQLNLSRF